MKGGALVPMERTAAVSFPDTVRAETKEMIHASLSENTLLAYGRAWDRWETWLAENNLQVHEATDELIANYLAQLYGAGYAPTSITLALSGIRFRYKDLGLDYVAGDITRATLQGIRRRGRDRGRGQAPGATIENVHLVARKLSENGTLRGLRDALILSVMSDALLRASELLGLKVSNAAVEPDGTGRLFLDHSKTDQEGDGAVLFMGSPTMRIFSAYVHRAQLGADDPLIIGIDRWDRPGAKGKQLTRQALNKITRRIGRAHFGIGNLSSHSFRVGSAQSLVARGAGLAELQEVGRWKSPEMPAHYSRGQRASRNAIARLVYG